ncbi:gephyrin-like molybdotransferase Glp [Aquimarina hainanensis]|uniref:Molybdopterin molybdenumtransferase n=1 Tax=Aquimarina hainanensis TaxID=1578017 RepID=A0ABW5N8I1_9FLAO
MISVEEAIQKVVKTVQTTTTSQTIRVREAVGEILSKDVIAPINMPPFRQSAMDGYALNLYDNTTYEVRDEVKAGDQHHPVLEKGEAVRIFTGAAVPDTANTVIMQERVVMNENTIAVEGLVNFGDNIRLEGEQIKKGEIALKKDTIITVAGIGYLLSLGIQEIQVYKKPSIGVVVTGNELIEPGKPLSTGKVYDSNGGMLATALQSLEYKEISEYSVKDQYETTKEVLLTALKENDVIVLSGGISVGTYDYVGKALKELGVEEIFYKVKQKPGKPLFFGRKKNKIVFALPGNPAAALSCFYLYVYPALEKLRGNKNFSLDKKEVTSISSFEKKGNRAQFLKAILEENTVTILEGQSSAMLQTFAVANALVYIPEERSRIMKNDTVEVICLPI